MKTSLDFIAPADLSVGQIRITNGRGFAREWMATPHQRTFKQDLLEPGYYRADIAPAGVAPQSVVFEVKPGEANTVALPDFTALTVNGAGTSFLGVHDHEAALASLYSQTAEFIPQELTIREFSAPPVAETSRILTVGLSMERADKPKHWGHFNGSCKAEISGGGRLSLEIAPPDGWTPALPRRVLLSAAIEGLRIERLFLPLFRGGTNVNITPSASGVSDISLDIKPADPDIRALWRALEAGTREHAAAVRDQILQIKDRQPVIAPRIEDPWAAMLAGLLFLRFPEEFGSLDPIWTHELCNKYHWAADTFIIRARQLASAAGETPEDIRKTAIAVIDLLKSAQTLGSPYFSLANQYFNDLGESLSTFDGLSQSARDRLTRIRGHWQRNLVLQRGAGAAFSWISRDRKLEKQGILVPRREVTGHLHTGDMALVFRGWVHSNAISFASPAGQAPKENTARARSGKAKAQFLTNAADTAPFSDCPALARPPGPADDPNKGRFGGREEAQGFRLSAQFHDDESEQEIVPIALSVEADDPASLNLGDYVWLCLHPTFRPMWVKLYFHNRKASLTVQAWGGFTAGAWLPAQQIELECDLATLPSAPRVIRER